MKSIDLTLTISQSIPTFPGTPKSQFILWSTLKEDGYNLELLFLSSHTGTHLDAPYHFVKNGAKIHQIPLDRLLGVGILIKIKKGKNQEITKDDLISFERKNGNIPKYSSVIFHTGWQKNLHDDSYFINNPGLSESAAKYLISKKINLVGIDSPSIDLGTNQTFSIHKILAKNNVLIVENLSNLNKISSSKMQLVLQ
jgi:kynurenine formamidase